MSTAGDRSGQPDPLKFWRDLYGQNEAAWSKLLEQGLNSEAFAQMMGQTLEAYASFQTALRESLNRYLETMNLPSRDDFGRIGAQLVALETKIDALDDKLDEIQDRLEARARLFEALMKRLDEQDDKLVELNESLDLRDRRVEEMLGRFVAPRTAPRGATSKREDKA